MRIFRPAQSTVNVWRVCIARENPDTKQMECRSLYEGKGYFWTPLNINRVLKGTWFVGTKPEFCMSYYAGMSELAEGEFEVLLTLEVPKGNIPLQEEDAYMGSEAVVTDPIVLDIRRI